MEEKTNNAEQPARRPLVATLVMAAPAKTYFNLLREQHFPAERNHLQAHLTLFHALPDEPWVISDLEELTENQQPFEVMAQSIQSLGNGTAFKIMSPDLPALHQKLQKRWFDSLTSQDRQKRNFHITIQNKVASPVAKALQATLAKDFEPFSFAVTGIELWRYLGGPWEYLTTMGFDKDRI